MNDSTGPAGDLIGTSVPGGTYELAGFEDWILRDTVYAGESDHAHPIAAFIGAQRGMGVSVSETMADTTTEKVSVSANSRNMRPTMPVMKSSGMKTAMREIVSEMMVKPICRAPL